MGIRESFEKIFFRSKLSRSNFFRMLFLQTPWKYVLKNEIIAVHVSEKREVVRRLLETLRETVFSILDITEKVKSC